MDKNAKSNMMLDVLKQNQVCLNNLQLGLTKLYFDIEFTNHRRAYYMKFKYRRYINKLLKFLWRNKYYQQAFQQIIQNPYFEKYFNKIMTDTNSHMDDGLLKI